MPSRARIFHFLRARASLFSSFHVPSHTRDLTHKRRVVVVMITDPVVVNTSANQPTFPFFFSPAPAPSLPCVRL